MNKITKTKKFTPLKITGKFSTCGIPIIFDTYQYCDYNCLYCYNHQRVILGKKSFEKECNLNFLKNTFHKVYDTKEINEKNLLHKLLEKRITLHGGVQGECFQPKEEKKGMTKKAIEICNEYEQKIMFTTKTDRLYDVPVNPELHSFSLSVSNLENHKIEPNVPRIENRIEFYNQLKNEGYKVSIGIEPFIPTITDWKKIIDTFIDAEHFHIEAIRLTPQNPENNEIVLDAINMEKSDFKNLGVLNLKQEFRYELYMEMIDYFNERGLSYSFSDSDMHHLSNNYCCCGDSMIDNFTSFNNTSLIQKYGLNYSIEDVMEELGELKDCNAYSYFASNRVYGLKTVEDFWRDRFHSPRHPMSPKFNYVGNDAKQMKLM